MTEISESISMASKKAPVVLWYTDLGPDHLGDVSQQHLCLSHGPKPLQTKSKKNQMIFNYTSIPRFARGIYKLIQL